MLDSGHIEVCWTMGASVSAIGNASSIKDFYESKLVEGLDDKALLDAMTQHIEGLNKRESANEVKKVLIIGAAGAIGKCLTQHLLENNIEVVAALRKTPLPESISSLPGLHQEFGVDCQNEETIRNCFKNHNNIDCCWNLAAPLSVETAGNPELAYDVVVNGMDRLLKVMREYNVSRICFSDSIGSYGGAAPRTSNAAWLVNNPTQDPGSEYGLQKRKCRELMRDFVNELPNIRTCRWAIIPGVLHGDSSWGAGTTEYALDALKCASESKIFNCPVEEDVYLPMIWRDDLIKGLYALTIANKNKLIEPDGGYAMAGLSFTPIELFNEIKKRNDKFEYYVEKDIIKLKSESPAAVFARLWVDYLTADEALRDLGFEAVNKDIGAIIDRILQEWSDRGI